MIRVILDIHNKTAHPCSPLEFVRKHILFKAKEIIPLETNRTTYDTPYAEISINHIEQI